MATETCTNALETGARYIEIADDDAAGWRAEALRLRALAASTMPDSGMRARFSMDRNGLVVTAVGVSERELAALCGFAVATLLAGAAVAGG